MTSFYPAVNGRATSQLGITRLLFQIHHDELAIQDLQTQLSTGRRVTRPSQDPSAAIRALAAQRQLEYKSQIDDNLLAADTILGATESTLAQAQSILNDVRGVAVQSVGTTYSPEEKEAFVNQIEAAISKLTELGNAKFRDQYLFGGSDVLSSPLELVGDTIRFKGNAEELRTVSDYASTITANVTANDAFGVQSSRIVSTVDLNPRVSGETPLTLLNRGDGVRGGAISFSNGLELVQVDLADVHDLNDVMDRINATEVGGRGLQASLSTNGLNISYLDGSGGLLRINEVGSGNMAEDLGINNSGTPGLSPVNGKDLNPQATKTTPLARLFAGAGITIGDSFQIKQGDKTFGVSTTGLATIEDLINRIHRSGAQVVASLDPSGRYLQVQSIESGSTLTIGENGGNLASRLGLRTMDLGTSLKSLNFGQGVFSRELGNDLVIQRSDGSELQVNLDGALNLGDVLNKINNHVDNFNPALRVTASLANSGNGIVLSALNGSQPISVRNAGGSQAAWGLGLVARDSDRNTGAVSGSLSIISGADVSGIEVDGVFNTLLRIKHAVQSDRLEDMIHLTEGLDEDMQRMSLARGFVGTRQQSIGQIQDLSAEHQLQLKQIESDELDADLAEVISELTARQAALQASLQLMGTSSQLSLFNFI